jgi:hypothetical protein
MESVIKTASKKILPNPVEWWNFPFNLKKKKKKYNTVTKYDSKNKEYFEKSSSWLAQLRLAYISFNLGFLINGRQSK